MICLGSWLPHTRFGIRHNAKSSLPLKPCLFRPMLRIFLRNNNCIVLQMFLTGKGVSLVGGGDMFFPAITKLK